MNFFDLSAPIYDFIHFGAKRTFKKLEKIADFKKSDKVLDLGGGVGRISKFLVGRVQEIIVVDPSSKMLEKCRTRAGLNCVVSPAEKLPFLDNYFDKIVIIDAFHHFENHEKACQEIKRVLKKDGEVVMEEFNPIKPFGWLVKKMEKLLKMGSLFFTPDALSSIFEKFEFETKLIYKNKSIYYLIAKKIWTKK